MSPFKNKMAIPPYWVTTYKQTLDKQQSLMV